MGYLRLWLALVVVITHSGPPYIPRFLHGHLAVNIFFCLAGFYMAMIYEDRYGGDFKRFILSRWSRFFPPYWAVLALSLLFLWWARRESLVLYHAPQLFSGQEDVLGFWAKAYLWASMLLQWGIEWSQWLWHEADGSLSLQLAYQGQGTHLAAYQPVAQAWSLGMEELFCLTLPFWLRCSSPCLAVLVLLGALGRFAFMVMGYSTYTVTAFPPLGFIAFFSGILAWRFQLWRRPGTGALARAAAFTLLAVVSLVPLLGYEVWRSPVAFLGLLNGLVLLSIVALGPLWDLSRDWPWERPLGELSYPLYLVHLLVRWVCDAFLSSDYGSWSFRSTYVLLSLAAAVALLYLLIKPMDRWRHKRFLVQRAA